jgi:hypothetical protein
MINSNEKLFTQHLLSKISLLLLLGAFGGSAMAATTAGTIISNMAVGEYKEEGSSVVQTSRSNLVQTTIIPVYSFNLTSNNTKNVIAGQTVYFPHTLTNTGNATDSYNLAVTNNAEGGFDYNNLLVYLDVNRDGLPDGAAISSYSLATGESVGLLVGAIMPAGVTVGQLGQVTLSAAAQSNAVNMTNIDTGTVTNQSTLIVRKKFSATNAATGSIVTVRIDYNNPSATATGVVTLTDVLSAGQLSYTAGSENWNGVAVDPAIGNDPAGINYTVNANTVTASLTSVAANSSGYIEFRATVTRSSAGQIINQATINYDHDNNTSTTAISDSTNIASLMVNPTYGVEINGVAASASNAPADNLVIAPSVATGGEVVFRNYVWNTGNTDDRFNLTFTNNGLPTPHQIEFYRADGVTPLLDTNGDGIPDTGNMLAGEKLEIVVKARFPTTHADTTTTNYSVFPQVQSVSDPSKTDTVQDRTSLIVTNAARLVDLTNRPENSVNGLGNGNVSNAGAAWKTLAANSGQSVVFPLAVKHTGTATAYSLSADADGDFSKLELPSGVASVRYYSTSTADCSVLGQEVGETGLLNDNETQLYCAVVQFASVAASVTNVPIFFKVDSATYVSSNNSSNPSFDVIKNAITINSLNSSGTISLTPDLRGQIAVGGTVVYSHTLVNQSTLDLDASYHFVINNSQVGFNTTLYYDANNNGVFESSDPQIQNLSTVTGGQLSAGERIRLFAKVQHSGSGGQGVVDISTVALQNASNQTVAKVTDITTISEAQIRLTKLQAKDDDCNGAEEGSFTTSTLTIGRNQNGTGQCVLYKLVVQNQGPVAIGVFNFHDATPAATVMAFAPSCTNCTSVAAPAITQAGDLTGTLPSIASGTSHEFTFGVRYVGQ